MSFQYKEGPMMASALQVPQTYGLNGPVKDANEPTNSRIRDGVTYLEQQMSELHSLMSSLESRLETVTTPVPPQPAAVGAGNATNAPVSHLMDRLAGLSHELSVAHVRVRSLLSRIEV